MNLKGKSKDGLSTLPTTKPSTAVNTDGGDDKTKAGDDKDALDILMHIFPCGSITGAPKIRAMEIIDELSHLFDGFMIDLTNIGAGDKTSPDKVVLIKQFEALLSAQESGYWYGRTS